MPLNSSKADRISSLVLLALGISMLIGGFLMDRLEIRQIHPASIPGLLPMGLGTAMIICAVLLFYSSSQGLANESNARSTSVKNKLTEPAGSYKDLLVTALFSIIYAAGLVGNIPFFAATAIFIFLFSVYFLWQKDQSSAKSKLQISALCAIYAIVFAAFVSVLFRYAFLVRLP